MASPSRFKNGVNNLYVGHPLANFPLPTPIGTAYVDFHDFDQYVSGDWTVTNTTSHQTIGLIAGAYGLLSIAGGASSVSTDIGAIQGNPFDFNFTSGQEVWFSCTLTADVAANNLIIAGLASSVATMAPSDGIYFSKAAGSATVDLVVRKSSTSSTLSAVATMVDATSIKLAFYYNGKDTVYAYVNDVQVAAQTTLTNLPTATALGKCLGIKLAAAAPTTAYVTTDYLLAAQDRV